MQSDFTMLEVVAGTALVVIAVVLLVLFFPAPHAGDAATWAGAIGAFLAFGGTICIATSETRRRERHELVRARLHAASLLPRITHAHAVVERVCEQLMELREATRRNDSIMRCVIDMSKIDIWSIDELIPLTPLSNNLAIHLSDAAGQIDMARRVLSEAAQSLESGLFEVPPHLADTLYRGLAIAERLIAVSMSDCTSAAARMYRNPDE